MKVNEIWKLRMVLRVSTRMQCFLWLLVAVMMPSSVVAQGNQHLISQHLDSLSNELRRQLLDPLMTTGLNYPNSVKRFYSANGMRPNWLLERQNIGPTASAMLLLDCVRQFGLERRNYHPEILSYELMHKVMDVNPSASIKDQIGFEIFLTDAMMSMVNHLHYGRFNPVYHLSKLENDLNIPIRAEEFLLKIAKSDKVMDAIVELQPKMRQYRLLQEYMKLMVGQYACDSYEAPEVQVRLIALNLERMRWSAIDADNYLQVNIPSFELTYVAKDSATFFKVVVGQSATPTPLLQSRITHLETAPDWNIPQNIFIKELLPKAEKDSLFFDKTHTAVYDSDGKLVTINAGTLKEIKKRPRHLHAKQSAGCDNALGSVVFRFSNPYGIYLHDTPLQQLFSKQNRALSHGCIRVARATELAKQLLIADGQTGLAKLFTAAVSSGKKKKFMLKSPLPIMVTYQTISVREGLLVSYPDSYKLDSALLAKMYAPETR